MNVYIQVLTDSEQYGNLQLKYEFNLYVPRQV